MLPETVENVIWSTNVSRLLHEKVSVKKVIVEVDFNI